MNNSGFKHQTWVIEPRNIGEHLRTAHPSWGEVRCSIPQMVFFCSNHSPEEEAHQLRLF